MKTSPELRQTGNPVETGKNARPDTEQRRLFNSKELFGEAQEIEIAHNDTNYRLRKTSLGKLILTK